jgi:hypothetical protein
MRGTGLKATFGVAGTSITRNNFLNCSMHFITPGYFDTLRMRLISGRDFMSSEKEDKQKPRAVLVNLAFVHRFFPNREPLGQLFGARGPDGLAAPQNQIVGVVSDAKYRSLREAVPPTIYQRVTDGFDGSFVLHVRTRYDPVATIAPVREVLRRLAPGLPFIEVRTLRQEVEASLWQERLLAWLSTLFGGFAALLAGIGLYGSLDFGVKARRREIGVRAALGASPSRLVRFLSREALLVVGAGAAVGVAFYAASAKWIRQALYGGTSSDPLALAAALFVVAIVVVLAIVSAVWRASHMDAASALRQE